MSALAYRSGSFTSAGDASGGDLTLTRPTGTVDGDRVVVAVYFEPATTTITVSNGPWESVTRILTGYGVVQVFAKTASSEPASYTISNNTAGNQWRQACAIALQNGTGTGTLIDVSATAVYLASATRSSETAPSVTTTDVNRMLVFGHMNSTDIAPSGMTGAASNLAGSVGGLALGYALFAAAGATGTTYADGSFGTTDVSAIHAAIISDFAGGGAAAPARGHLTPMGVW